MRRPRFDALRPRGQRLLRRLAGVPAPLALAGLYAAAILVGALCLQLPFATTAPITWLQAGFTATSAITVTGLAVVDTGTVYTGFGQAVIMALIQLGGLGLMTFAILIAAALGLPVGLGMSQYLREDLNRRSMHELTDLVWVILRLTLVFEVAGALIVAPSFIAEGGWARGAWDAAFHSVSAFNNAGFSTYSDGLMRFSDDPVVLLTLSAQFMIGGLGYVVLREVMSRRRSRSWSLHTKIMLIGTAILVPWSVGMVAALEWTNPDTLGGMASDGERWLASWFQGVTTRTAGFNSVDIGALRDATALMFISLMLIGGGPTSTAGGIKVTTFAVMLLATVAFVRRRSEIALFGRRIGTEEMLKATAIVAISVIVCFVAVFLLVVFDDAEFLDLGFETASAFGTVGLSRNLTPSLSGGSQVVLIALMFLGRVGPLTLGFFLATRSRPRVRYPKGEIALG